ncbi:leucine-rich repeat domain-containing protein [Breznakiellaceae bacterium SP9]
MRKLLVVLLVLASANALFAQSAAPASDFKYALTEDGKGVVIQGYLGEGATVVIPAKIEGFPVTAIGDMAFFACSSLTLITIPSSVTSIGVRAFSGCSSLKWVWLTIPSSVTSIGKWAFNGCSSLTSIAIPGSVTTIDSGAFSGCSSLTSITIPSSVTAIGDYAFSSCSSLTWLTIPSSVTAIGPGAFYDCSSLTWVTIQGSVTKFEYGTGGIYVFSGCSKLSPAARKHLIDKGYTGKF